MTGTSPNQESRRPYGALLTEGAICQISEFAAQERPTRGRMLGNSVLLTVLAFSPTLQRYGAAPTAAASAVGTRPCVATMGLFDAFKKGFENKDYSQSPGTYEQTNALSRRFECALPSACCLIADALCSNGYDTAATIT